MKIEYVKGDVLKTHCEFILHGCNAQGVMGAGVAKAIRDEYPFAYDQYREAFTTRGLRLGEIQIVRCMDKTIINAITQLRYGRDGIRYVSYDAVADAMASLEETLYGEEVAMPMIGSGLAGGDWNIIKAIIEAELKTVKPYVYQL